jgi:hypothetical protein
MWHLCMFLILQSATPQAIELTPAAKRDQTPPAATRPSQPATSTAPAYDTGPLRAEINAMREMRFWFLEEPPPGARSALDFQVRVAGERLAEVARVGNVIFTEAVDNTGRALVDASTYTAEQRTDTRPMTLPPDRLRSVGLMTGTQVKCAARNATTVKLRGSIRLILGKDKQDITIDNPLQYVGKIIENEKLKQLGVEIKFLAPEELKAEGEAAPPTASKVPTLQYVKGQERVQTVAFHDASLKPIRHRERPVQTKQDQPAVSLILSGAELSNECQLVLQVFPSVEDIKLPIELDAQPLP